MRPKMSDVAQRAGVSIATVSRVLNKTKYVDAEVEKEVLRAVEELKYIPDQRARWLSSRRSNIVGLIIPSMEDSVRARFLHACTNELRTHDHNVMVALSDGDRDTERELLRAQLQSHVAAIILITPSIDTKLRVLVSESEIPILMAINADTAGRRPSIVFDDNAAAKALMSACFSGCNALTPGARVAILTRGRGEYSVAQRIRGFKTAVDTVGSEEPTLVEVPDDDDGYNATQALLRSSTPGLIAATTDYLAIAAIRAVHDIGYRVPDDIAITGFGENHYSHTCTPSLTTVRLDGAELGRRCGAGAISLINDATVARIQRIPSEIVAGESCPLDSGFGTGRNLWPR